MLLFTRSEWVSFSLFHCIALGNVVKLRQPTKLFPNSVIIEECSHGIIDVPYQALGKKKTPSEATLSWERTNYTGLSLKKTQAFLQSLNEKPMDCSQSLNIVIFRQGTLRIAGTNKEAGDTFLLDHIPCDL